MTRLPLALLAAALLGARLAAQHHAPAGEGLAPAELFGSRCSNCHVAPDPRFAVERAWLEQVLDTA